MANSGSGIVLNVLTLPEPVVYWQDVSGYDLLGLLYNNPVENALRFQIYAQMTLIRNHQKINKSMDNIVIMERSAYSARFCFNLMAKKR